LFGDEKYMNKRIIEVVEYDPTWPKLFEAERDILRKIHHVGSTAVPGLAAKPIIDILIEVTGLEALDALHEDMKVIGYKPKGEFGIPGRRYYQKGGKQRTHQIHAFVTGDFNVTRHIAFRDYLRANSDVAREYGEVKKSVAKTCDNDINKYCDGKDAYVKRVESIAVKELAPNKAGL
jgi:GrpB-like predicted nucleotidyltransferase (UPF0157 family)